MDNRNFTTRVNYDQTITPTVLFHVGVVVTTRCGSQLFPAKFDENSIGLHGYFPIRTCFPSSPGLFNTNSGGWQGPGAAVGSPRRPRRFLSRLSSGKKSPPRTQT